MSNPSVEERLTNAVEQILEAGIDDVRIVDLVEYLASLNTDMSTLYANSAVRVSINRIRTTLDELERGYPI